MEQEGEGYGDGPPRDEPPQLPIQPEEDGPPPNAHDGRRRSNHDPADHARSLVNWTRALAIITTLLFFATAAASWVSFLQLLEIKATAPIAVAQAKAAQTIAQSAKDSLLIAGSVADSAKVQAGASMKSADAAVQQLKIARGILQSSNVSAEAQSLEAKIAKAEQRPLFSVNNATGSLGSIDVMGFYPLTTQLDFKNVGKLAKVIGFSSNFAWGPPLVPSYSPFVRQTQPAENGGGVSLSFVNKFNNDELDKISKLRRYYVYGYIRYEDSTLSSFDYCFAEELSSLDGKAFNIFKPFGGPAFQCDGEVKK